MRMYERSFEASRRPQSTSASPAAKEMRFPSLALLVLLATCAANSSAAREQQPEPPQAGASDPLRGMVWNEALDAGTNVRYWSTLAERASDSERTTRIWSIVTGVFCFAFPFISRQYATGAVSKFFSAIAEIVGVIAFGCLLFSMLNTAATYNDLSGIHGRWATLAPELKELFDVADTLKHDELQLRYDALMTAKQAIVPVEPAETDHELMHQSWRAEMHARDQDEWAAQVEAKKQDAPQATGG
jgi:hypothetical protein